MTTIDAQSSPAHLAGDLNSRLAVARPRLARLARLSGATADEAEDITQETLLTAWRTLDHLRDADRFDAWLDGICRNICRRVARSSATERERMLGTLPTGASEEDETPPSAFDDIPTSDGDPLDELTRQELVTLLDSALGHLNDAAREAVQLRYLADLPTDEAAARLGLTINTLEARLSRARKQLREALNGPLRERAVEFGLALAPADEAGWRDSRLWCHFCGRSRMQGILEDAPDGGGRLTLRCPLCWHEQGAVETDIPSMDILAGVKTFKPAMRRMMRLGAETLAPALQRTMPCVRCGKPLHARIVRGEELPMFARLSPMYTEHFYIAAACHDCDTYVTGAAAIAGRGHDAIMRFILERNRWIAEPERLMDYQGSPAIRFSLYDPTADERLVYFADPQTLTVRGIASS
jgi:RNA polymerase sigma-70 factor (ECF subfamily)